MNRINEPCPQQAFANAAAGLRAVILAGGRGARLRPFTVNFPKPLMPLGDKPIIEILLHYLARQGITDVTLTVGHLKELIKVYFLNAPALCPSCRISFVEEESPTGTAGSLASVAGLSETFLVMNGDVLTDLNLHELVEFHHARNAILTVATHVRRLKIDFGLLDFDDQHRIRRYHEKPEQVHHVSMGIYVYEPAVLRYIEPGRYLDFPDLVLRLIEQGETVCAFPTECLWLDIGRPDDYARAQELYSQGQETIERV
jgi:NDP-sugar pyrophosphorylase family protein